ncbi:MAG: hypothetical protein WD314_01335 [Trueperaceae bacterium]
MLRVRLRLLTASLGALALGLGLYLVSRGPTLLSSAGPDLPSAGFPLAGNLPSALHTYAFALLGLALLPLSRLSAASSCLAWLAASALLELAQLMPAGAALTLPLAGAFALGTFDPADLLASAVGAVAAFLTAYSVLNSGPSRPVPSARRGPLPGRRPLRPTSAPGPASATCIAAVRLAANSILAGAFLFTTVATSPPPPLGFLSTDLEHPCPGSKVTLSWTLAEGVGGMLSTSEPDAVEPRFEPRRVEESGQAALTVLANVEFHLVADGESPAARPADAQLRVVPEQGIAWSLYNHGECSGGAIEWDPVVVPVGVVDSHAVVDTVEVEPAESDTEDNYYSGAVFVEREGRQATLDPGTSTDALRGTQFVGAWELRAAEPVENQCAIARPYRTVPAVSIRVRITCP